MSDIPDAHWIGGWVEPRAVQDVMVNRSIPKPLLEFEPQLFSV
jgi:hypothetical protein